jgi:hypothetical protein
MKLIQLPHKVCGLTCMINGLEDLYEQQTGHRLPDWLLFYVSGMAGFVYIKSKNAPTPRMVFWGTQVAKYQYQALADIVGFRWQMVENRSFAYTLNRAKASIDQGAPALLGALDMYHLPYYDKFYHNFHVPIHHVLLVGYDEAQAAALVLDCDRVEPQAIPYADLEPAWDVTIPGMGKKNTFYTFEFNHHIADIETIARQGLRKHAAAMLAAPVSMLGLKGMRKLARELPRWPQELNAAQLDISLRHLVEFTGFPPVPPNRLTGYDAPDNHAAGRDVFASLLYRLAEEYGEPAGAKAAAVFEQSGQILRKLTDVTIDFILGQRDTLVPAAELISRCADLEEQAYRLLWQEERP